MRSVPETRAIEAVKAAVARADTKAAMRGRSGAALGSAAAFSAQPPGAASSGVPPQPPLGVLPSGVIPWPDGLRRLLDEAAVHRAYGLLPAHQCAWVVADDKLYLWHPASGSTTFTTVPSATIETVAAVSLPAFDSRVKDGILITSSKLVAVIAVRRHEHSGALETLDCSAAVDLVRPLRAVRQCRKSGRVFAGRSDGSLVELVLEDRDIKIVDVSALFATTPGLAVVGMVVSGFHRAWSNRAAVIDLAVDQANELVYVLTADDELSLWALSGVSDISCVATATHSVAALRATIVGAAPTAHSPLRRIFVGSHGGQGGHTDLVAVAANGDRFVYATTGAESHGLGFASRRRLKAAEYLPSTAAFIHDGPAAAAGREAPVGLVGIFDDVCVAAHPNAIVVSSVPSYLVPAAGSPARDVVGVLATPLADTLVDVAEWTPAAAVKTHTRYGEMVAQLHAPRRTFAAAAADGLHLFRRLHLADAVALSLGPHGALSTLDGTTSLPPAEAAAQLIAVAGGLAARPDPMAAVELPSALTTPDSRRVLDALRQPAPLETARAAAQLLRGYTGASLTEGRYRAGITVPMSPFVVGVSTVLGRLLAPLWTEHVFDARKGSLRVPLGAVRTARAGLLQLVDFLSQTRGELWLPLARVEGLTFDANGATLAADAEPTASTAADVQHARVTELAHLAALAAQVLRFVEFLGDVSSGVLAHASRGDRETRQSTVRELIERPQRIAAFARRLLNVVVDAEHHQNFSNYDTWLQLFDEMERACPALFSKADTAVQAATVALDQARLIDNAARRDAAIADAVASVSVHAKALLDCGALDGLATANPAA